MNSYINERGWEWIADTTFFVKQYYYEKKATFGDKYNLLGLDFYANGRFIDVIKENSIPVESSDLVLSFDWREKHDAHHMDSKYWDNSDDQSGWITGVVHQGGCASCAIFGTVAVLEAMINLFFNEHIDTRDNIRLSEKDAFNCSQYDESNPGYVGCECNSNFGKEVTWVLAYIENSGIVDEDCWPYDDPRCYGMGNDCSDFTPDPKCPQGEEKITVMSTGREVYYINSAPNFGLTKSDYLKSLLIENGPLIITIENWSNSKTLTEHVVALVGFETDDYGRTYWICKNSHGIGYGDQGYINMPLALSPEPSYNDMYIENMVYAFKVPIEMYPTGPVEYETLCVDKDKDGYYNWGLCDREEDLQNDCYCASGTEDEEDSNDNDERIGPYDQYYHGKPVKPLMRVKCNNQIVSNGGFYTFYNVGNPQAQNFEIRIENKGNAQLNLKAEEGTWPPIPDISFSGPNANNFSKLSLPPMNIGMEDFETFTIHFCGQESSPVECYVTISVDEIDIPDYTFAIVFTDCDQTSYPEYISGPVLWDDDWKIKLGDVYIINGAELTIKGNYGFGANANLIVEQGGRLIIDGGLLTKACNQFWPGIDVWGNYSQSQYPSLNQGFVKIINNGSIELAEIAIETIRYAQGEHSYSNSGGIVQAKDAFFKDNVVDVYFYPYNNFNPVTEELVPNLSYFRNVQFASTGFNCDVESHVILNDVHGINFKGCTFANISNMAACPYEYIEGIGIYSYNSDFFISDYCINPSQQPCIETDQCEFLNLDYGIYALANRPNDYIHIDTSIFTNNRTGIYMSGIDDQVIISNTFNIRKVDTNDHSYDIFGGIYLDQCTGFQVEENMFYTHWGMDYLESEMSIGIVVNNSGTNDNQIYNNYFAQLYIGILAQNLNKSSDGEKGLQILCNDNMKNIYDFAVTTCWLNSEDYGIREDQGSVNNYPLAPASNIFSYAYNPAIGNEFSDYYNDCAPIQYYHHSGPQTIRIVPQYYYNITPLPSGYNAEYDKNTNCPSNLNSTIDMQNLAMQKIYYEQKADSIDNLLNILVDGGNTDELSEEVQNSIPPEVLEIRNELLTKSPYLSDTVMISAVDKEDVLPSVMITEILTANPQSAKSRKVMDAVDNRSLKLSGDMLDQINQGLFIIGEKEALESSYSFYKSLCSFTFNQMIRYYKSDTIHINSSMDSIILLLSGESDINSKYRLAFEYLSQWDTANAMLTLNNIPVEFLMNNDQVFEHQLTGEYFDIMLGLCERNGNLYQLDSIEKAQLYYITNNSEGVVGAYSRNILSFFDTLTYYEPYILPQTGLKSNESTNNNQDFNINENNSFYKIYPNPSKYYVIIESKENVDDAILEIFIGMGEYLNTIALADTRYSIIDTRNLMPGIYLFRFSTNNKIIESHKILITR